MNGIYLYLWLSEIKNKIIGLVIDDIEYMNRLIQIVCGEKSIFISLYPEAPAVFFSKRSKQGFEKLNLFEDTQSSRILNIEQPNFMPVLELQMEKFSLGEMKIFRIIISLYRDAPNFSIKTATSQKNLYPRYIKKTPKQSIFELTELELESLCSAPNFSENIVHKIEGVDKYFARELNIENIKKLGAILQGAQAKPRLVTVSPLRISFFAKEYIKEYSSLNTLLEDGLMIFTKAKAEVWSKSRKKELIGDIKRRVDRLRRELLKDEEIEQYRVVGELILTNIAKIKKGVATVKLFNPYTQKENEIRLDPIKTPQANAQAYFTKYKKIKRGQPKIKQKIKSLEKKIDNITKQAPEITEAATFIKPAIKKEKPEPFRSFPLPSGSIVYVGKNAKSNEKLTLKFAAPNDYFFHVRGYQGAHTILKAKIPKGQKPRKEDIQAAASIAAYFSKAKGQNNVPVSYTQRKYLKKNRKGKPGSVILMREEVIFAEPKLPRRDTENHD